MEHEITWTFGMGTPSLNDVFKISNIVLDLDSDTHLQIRNTSNALVARIGTDSDRNGMIEVLTKTGAPNVTLKGSWHSYFRNYTVVFGSETYDNSAQIKIDSTTRGFLPPRMTTIQKNAISSPATGLIVYDTTLNKLCVYTGSSWETITSS